MMNFERIEPQKLLSDKIKKYRRLDFLDFLDFVEHFYKKCGTK